MKNDGKCVNCGRVPLKSSTLCADCLAACSIERKYSDMEIGRLKEKNRRQQELIREIFGAFNSLIKAAEKEK